MTIGERFKQIRKNLNRKQDDFAKMLNIDPATLSRYENNRRVPDFDFLKQFGTLFNVSGSWLLFGKPPVYRTPDKEQDTRKMFLELLAAIEKQDGLQPSLTHVTDISKDTLGSTPEHLILMIEYMLKDPEVCRDMLHYFYLIQKPKADQRLAPARNIETETS